MRILEMTHQIDPKVDCVFKAILGAIENKNLLIHFLNAVLEPKKKSKIVHVEIINPYNEKEYETDKLSIVDIKAIDETDKLYQIEIQLVNHSALIERILYTWTSIYYSQMRKGDHYNQLRPVISIWILKEKLFPQVNICHLPFEIANIEHQLKLTEHLSINILQLSEWVLKEPIKTEKDRWIYLFKEGKDIDIDNPPSFLDTNTKEMRQAMQVMKRFSENQKNFLLYQSRMNALFKENTYIQELDDALKAKERERKAKERERKAKERERKAKEKECKAKIEALKAKEDAEKEIMRLRQLLVKQNTK